MPPSSSPPVNGTAGHSGKACGKPGGGQANPHAENGTAPKQPPGTARKGNGHGVGRKLKAPARKEASGKSAPLTAQPLTRRSTDASSSCSAASNQRTFEVQPGQAVHVVGHGPAILSQIKGRGKKKYQVKYPDGSAYCVARDQMIVPSLIQSRQPSRYLSYLGTAFDATSRQSSIPSATFSLVATMVGGGVLSLPYAMSQCGLVFGTMALFASGAASALTLDMLVDCARCTGRDTFELVGHAAFGETCRKVTIGLVFTVCWFALLAYFVLLADLLTPIVEAAGLLDGQSPEALRRTVLCSATLLLSPMCFKSNLHALRFMCFASVTSVLVVGSVITFRALQSVGQTRPVWVSLPSHGTLAVDTWPEYKLWPDDWDEALYVFPVFGLSFLCHFNALPTHQELARPTRFRIRKVFALTVLLTSILYLVFGMFGYVFAAKHTCGNIFLNFAPADALALFCRTLYGMVLMLNCPLVCQPCRNSLYRLIAGCVERESPQVHQQHQRQQQQRDTTSVELAPVPENASRNARIHVYRRNETHSRDAAAPAFDAFVPKDATVLRSTGEPTAGQRYVLTALILVSALSVSCIMRSVLVVWSVMGSTVCFAIAFLCPAAFWYKIAGHTASTFQRYCVLGLIGVVVALAVVGTIETLKHLDAPPCPPVSPADNPHELA